MNFVTQQTVVIELQPCLAFGYRQGVEVHDVILRGPETGRPVDAQPSAGDTSRRSPHVVLVVPLSSYHVALVNTESRSSVPITICPHATRDHRFCSRWLRLYVRLIAAYHRYFKL